MLRSLEYFIEFTGCIFVSSIKFVRGLLRIRLWHSSLFVTRNCYFRPDLFTFCSKLFPRWDLLDHNLPTECRFIFQLHTDSFTSVNAPNPFSIFDLLKLQLIFKLILNGRWAKLGLEFELKILLCNWWLLEVSRHSSISWTVDPNFSTFVGEKERATGVFGFNIWLSQLIIKIRLIMTNCSSWRTIGKNSVSLSNLSRHLHLALTSHQSYQTGLWSRGSYFKLLQCSSIGHWTGDKKDIICS